MFIQLLSAKKQSSSLLLFFLASVITNNWKKHNLLCCFSRLFDSIVATILSLFFGGVGHVIPESEIKEKISGFANKCKQIYQLVPNPVSSVCFKTQCYVNPNVSI